MLFAIAAFTCAGFFQLPEDPGPFHAGWRDVEFRDTIFNRGKIQARIHYPALSSGENQPANSLAGPFPLVAFQHGWIEPASDYDEFNNHLASWGFVVASIDTETGILGEMQRQARDTRSMLHWVESASNDPSSWLADLVDGGEWAACGHSMGASGLSYLVLYEPRVRSIVLFQPYRGSLLGNTSNGFNQFDQFTGRVLAVGGSQDLTNPPQSNVRPWYGQAESASRRFYILINGADHFGITDFAGTNGSLSGGEQHRVHRRIGSAYLRSDLFDEEDKLDFLFGLSSDTDPTTPEGMPASPALWTDFSANPQGELRFGVAGIPGYQLRLAASLGTGTTVTHWGVFGLDLNAMALLADTTVPAKGIWETQIPSNASFSGRTIWFQGLTSSGIQGAFTRVTSTVLP